MSINIITPCYNESEDIIFENICSIKNQVNKTSINHLCIFDGVERISEVKKFNSFNENLFFYRTKFNHADYGDYVRRLGTKITIKNKINAIGYLDADNTFEIDHFKTVLEKHNETGKKIVISQRNFISGDLKKNVLEHEFFDTNQITLFGDKIKIGLLWGRYPTPLSLIGDRIISNYIKTFHKEDIVFTDKKTVNYNYSKISQEKIKKFKKWHDCNYKSYKNIFFKKFGFNLEIK